MADHLGLLGDGDEMDLVDDIEDVFGVKFVKGELDHIRTVGEFFHCLEGRLPLDDDPQRSCATAKCFYSLRKVLQPFASAKLGPSTAISELRGLSGKQLRHLIVSECGLNPPSLYLSGTVLCGMVALMVLGIFSFFAGWPWYVALLSVAGFIGLCSTVPSQLPPNIKTLGDLADVVALRSLDSLLKCGARFGAKDAWNAYLDVLSNHTLVPTQDIAPETFIIDPNKAISRTS